MPDIRLRPANTSDLSLIPAIDSRADIILRPALGSDISLVPTGLPAFVAAATSSFTLAGSFIQSAPSMAGVLSAVTSSLDDDNDAAFVLKLQAVSDEEIAVAYVYGWMYA